MMGPGRGLTSPAGAMMGGPNGPNMMPGGPNSVPNNTNMMGPNPMMGPRGPGPMMGMVPNPIGPGGPMNPNMASMGPGGPMRIPGEFLTALYAFCEVFHGNFVSRLTCHLSLVKKLTLRVVTTAYFSS